MTRMCGSPSTSSKVEPPSNPLASILAQEIRLKSGDPEPQAATSPPRDRQVEVAEAGLKEDRGPGAAAELNGDVVGFNAHDPGGVDEVPVDAFGGLVLVAL